MRRDEAITRETVEANLINYAFRVDSRHRARLAEVCEQAQMPLSLVVNECLSYALKRLTVKPVKRMGLVFEDVKDDANEQEDER